MRERLANGDEEFLDLFVEEVRRFYPFFPAVLAKVRRSYEWRGYLFPEGRRVMFDLYGTNHDARNWRNPDRFHPERFADNAPTPFNLVPQGGDSHHLNHRCAGEWITIDLIKDAVRFLTREVRYEVPRQDLRQGFWF